MVTFSCSTRLLSSIWY